MKPTKASNRILLAYSGSVNTTVAIPWLAERYAQLIGPRALVQH